MPTFTIPRRAALPPLLGVLVLLVGGCTPGTLASAGEPASPQGERATQTSEGGQVTVAATWDGPATGTTFTVTLDTHSVDLDGIDLARLAVLRTDLGLEVAPTVWDAPKGGHHRGGALLFPSEADGHTVLEPEVRSIELVIRDVAGVPERSFQWVLSR